MRYINIIYTAIFICIIIIIFKSWFLTPEIKGGDWPYYFNETLKEFTFFPLSWNTEYNNGLGGIDSLYFLNIYQNFTILLSQIFNVPWTIIYKIFWFGFFIVLSTVSCIAFLKITLSNIKYWQLLIGIIIFISNTYILMVVGGGQMGVALGYAMAPLVLGVFIKLIDNFFVKISINKSYLLTFGSNLKLSTLVGLILAVQMMFDPRLMYLTLFSIGLYFIFKIISVSNRNISYSHIFFFLLLPISIALLLHSSWILPLLLFSQNPAGDMGQSYLSIEAVRFLSFANLSNSLALVHPNWPENIFGKTFFLKPEFLILPILAYLSLLFINFKIQLKNKNLKSNLFIHESNKKMIIFFSFLGLIGIFLAKGANPPFGELYIWLFEHVPGFVLFRDPTKFYLLIILAYSVLMPFSLEKIVNFIQRNVIDSQKINATVPVVFLLFWLFLIRPAVYGQLGGTFGSKNVPVEYLNLKTYLDKQPDFFRALWVPRRQRFSYYTNNHLAIEAEPLFGTRDAYYISRKLNVDDEKKYILELGIKYIIVPFDPYGEIFIKDRKYNSIEYEKTVSQLEKVSWLTKLDGFGKISIFKTQNSKDRFWLSKGGKISYKMINPVTYKVNVEIDRPQELNFSENYNHSWIAKTTNFDIISKKTGAGLNSFPLSKKGKYELTVIFSQQRYYEYGQIISLITFLCIVLVVFALQKKKV